MTQPRAAGGANVDLSLAPRHAATDSTERLINLAEKWLQAGFSIVPVRENKRPSVDGWKDLQLHPYKLKEACEVIVSTQANGIAVLGDYGGLFIFDFDMDKNGIAKEPFDLYRDFYGPWVAEAERMGIKPVYQPTSSGGRHIFVRCPEPLGNIKLASVEATPNPETGEPRRHTAIESRGRGGYAVLYDHTLDPRDIPMVSAAQFQGLVEAAMELDSLTVSEAELQAAIKRGSSDKMARATNTGLIGWFNQNHSVQSVLEASGYKLLNGKYLSPSSSSGNAGVVILHDDASGLELCYSHHSDVLGDNRAHDAFDTMKLLKFGGDFDQALAEVKRLKGSDRFSFGSSKPRVGLNNNGPKSIKDDNKGKSFRSTYLDLNNEQVDPNRDLASVTKNDLGPPPGPKLNQKIEETSALESGPKSSTSPTQESDLGPSDGYLGPPLGPKSFASPTQESDLGPPITTHAREDEAEQKNKPVSLKWGERKRPPPVRFCVDKLFQADAENLVAGEPGVGKSWLIVDLAVAVATGTPFLNRRTESGPVLFINFDDPTESLPRQFFDMTVRGRGYEPEDVPVHYWQPDEDKPWPSSGIITPEVFGLLKEAIKEIQPRLIIVDAYSSAFPSLDGNKGQDVVQVFEALRQLRVAGGSNTCMLLVDHTPKATLQDSKRRGVSGSQQKHARARTVHVVSHVDPSDVAGDNVVKWEVFKMNAAPYQAPFGIEREMDTLEGYARLKVRDLPEQTQAPGQSRAIKAALSHLQSLNGQVITRQDLMKAVIEVTNVSKRTVKRALEHSDFTSNENVETRQLEGRGSPVGFFWHGETPAEAINGYEALKQAVRSGKWAAKAEQLDKLKAWFEQADTGDEGARAKLETYLGIAHVKQVLGLDEANGE